MVITISEALKHASEQLKTNNIESFLADSLILLCHTLNCDKTYLLVHKNDLISKEKYEEYLSYVELRKNNMPVKYITENCEFMSLDFKVNKNVLIPRPDTEILVEKVLEDIQNKAIRVLDLCCGSGCIGISIAYYHKNCEVLMADISEDAIKVAGENIKKHSLEDRVSIVKADVLNEIVTGKFDIIVSNPPYINEEDYANLESDVKNYEPKLALIAEDDEYKFYKRILKDYAPLLNPGGKMYLEMGYNQSDYLVDFAKGTNKYKNIEIIKDLNGINRVIKGEI